MSEAATPRVAIVDYGVGNLYSIANACAQVELKGELVSSAREVDDAHAIVLPGVGAFGTAMAALRRLDLVQPIKHAVAAGKPVFGICLGLQLLMSESHEFGVHKGLGLIEGTVEHLGTPRNGDRALKVPHIGWTQIEATERAWTGTLLSAVAPGSFMYFVHTFRAVPADSAIVLSTSCYGDVRFCSSMAQGKLFACQFHPERSGPHGLLIYRQFRAAVVEAATGTSVAPIRSNT